ncbi:hypothetical protein DPEC_G00265170 [Dallia pectoralis]|uniref:Uncharacterized protein n=1 Tax=Dallia pectoralis TaxID=75939 RepID=A0ACC2FSK4_DALPE|nr:hypothetical protein DPEC_G00265170 [Dallia pectoralis]
MAHGNKDSDCASAVIGICSVNHQSRATSQNNISTRDRRVARSLIADQYSHSIPIKERHCPAPTPAPAPAMSSGGLGGGPRRPEGSLSSPSETWSARRCDFSPSQIPRGGGSTSVLHSRGSPCCSSLSSDSERVPVPSPRLPHSSSSFTGRLGQPPRGPLSLHMYSRKNVFLQHSLHTSELQALSHHEG